MSKQSSKPKLDSKNLRGLLEPGKYYDIKGNGLFLFIKPTGRKYWVQRLSIRGRRRDIGLGPYPETTLVEARDTAYANRLNARKNGIDPIAAKAALIREQRRESGIPTFEELARKRHEEVAPTFKDPDRHGGARPGRHAGLRLNTLVNHAFPHIGDIPVNEITAMDLKEMLMRKNFWLQKPATARKLRQRVGDVLRYAVGCGFRDDDPSSALAAILPKQNQKAVPRKAIPYKQVPAAVAMIRDKEGWEPTQLALEWLILTATRSGETRGARWSEIDMEARTWTIAADRTKTEREHIVPLPDRCMEILARAELYKSGESNDGFIFPSPFGGGRDKWLSDASMLKVMRDLELDGVVHGFRACFRTWTQEQTNAERPVAEAVLGHVNRNPVEAAYARSDYLDLRRPLMQMWADFVGGKGTKGRARVGPRNAD